MFAARVRRAVDWWLGGARTTLQAGRPATMLAVIRAAFDSVSDRTYLRFGFAGAVLATALLALFALPHSFFAESPVVAHGVTAPRSDGPPSVVIAQLPKAQPEPSGLRAAALRAAALRAAAERAARNNAIQDGSGALLVSSRTPAPRTTAPPGRPRPAPTPAPPTTPAPAPAPAPTPTPSPAPAPTPAPTPTPASEPAQTTPAVGVVAAIPSSSTPTTAAPPPTSSDHGSKRDRARAEREKAREERERAREEARKPTKTTPAPTAPVPTPPPVEPTPAPEAPKSDDHDDDNACNGQDADKNRDGDHDRNGDGDRDRNRHDEKHKGR